jgi:RNA polymerase sigma-70 factor (ECF subfamily)
MRSPEFMMLLTSSQSRLFAYILSLVLDRDQADDLLQQTNVILWEREEDFKLGTNFTAWSFRIAYFQVLAHRKKQQREALVFDDDVLAAVAEVAADCDVAFETRQKRLRRCLEKLSQRQREFIRRRYEAGANLETISLDTALSINAVKQLLFRARSILIRCVNEGPQQETLL